MIYAGLGPDGHGVEGEMTGGVPLGLAIANQIFNDALTGPEVPPGSAFITATAPASTLPPIPEGKISNMNLR